ncbi:hypothetical protein [Pseudomonas borbori]
MRTFALLDEAGICRALRQSAHVPQGFAWVEVDRLNPTWLHRPLPADAQIPPVVTRAPSREASAA